jgi:hypothetical protein
VIIAHQLIFDKGVIQGLTKFKCIELTFRAKGMRVFSNLTSDNFL